MIRLSHGPAGVDHPALLGQRPHGDAVITVLREPPPLREVLRLPRRGGSSPPTEMWRGHPGLHGLWRPRADRRTGRRREAGGRSPSRFTRPPSGRSVCIPPGVAIIGGPCTIRLPRRQRQAPMSSLPTSARPTLDDLSTWQPWARPTRSRRPHREDWWSPGSPRWRFGGRTGPPVGVSPGTPARAGHQGTDATAGGGLADPLRIAPSRNEMTAEVVTVGPDAHLVGGCSGDGGGPGPPVPTCGSEAPRGVVSHPGSDAGAVRRQRTGQKVEEIMGVPVFTIRDEDPWGKRWTPGSATSEACIVVEDGWPVGVFGIGRGAGMRSTSRSTPVGDAMNPRILVLPSTPPAPAAPRPPPWGSGGW